MTPYDYEVEVLTRIESLRSVARDWNSLADRFGSPLLGANWFLACAETLCAESDLRVLVVRSSGSLHGVAPLVIVRRDGVARLELLGASVLYEPAGLLYDSVDALHCLVRNIVRFRLPVVLARIDATELIDKAFKHLTRGRGVVITKRAATVAYVSAQGTWQAYERSMSSRHRYNFRHRRKGMERKGRVAVRIERPHSRTDLPRLLEQVYRVEEAGWKGRSGSALRTDDRVRPFMERYSELACESGTLRVCFLDVNDIPIAAMLGIEEAQRFWSLKIGYDEQWKRFSPGIQLNTEAIKYTFDRRLEGYEFLGSEEVWQATWPHDHRLLISLWVYPISLGGLWAVVTDLRRSVAGRIHRMLS